MGVIGEEVLSIGCYGSTWETSYLGWASLEGDVYAEDSLKSEPWLDGRAVGLEAGKAEGLVLEEVGQNM